jgi:hypothetical protein
MRRVAGVLTVVGALWAAPGIAQAATTDLTSGSASYECQIGCGADASWTAHGTPSDPHGTARIRLGQLDSRASVDCVSVVGNRASISGVLERPTPGLEGPFYELDLEDNGSPGKVADRMSFGTSRFPVDCTFGTQFTPTFPVSRGNVLVQDNTP